MPAIFKMKFDSIPEWGEEGEFELTRLTHSQLSHFKQWFSDEYGQKVSVMTKAIFEDGDAVRCVVWACRRENNLPVTAPNQMPDFDTSEVFVPRPQDTCPECNGSGKVPHEDEVAEVPLARMERPSPSQQEPNTQSGEITETLTNSGSPGSLPSSTTSMSDQQN